MNESYPTAVDISFYLKTQLATAICLMCLSPITIISNVLLLLIIFRDPLKCFRSPVTYFIVALALVDISTGIVIEPFFVMDRMLQYLTWSLILYEPYISLSRFGAILSYVGLNASFLLVLGLTVSQYIAITYPLRYRSIVTTPRVLACICVSCLYFTGFILLQFAGVPLQILLKVDLHLHSTLITVLLTCSSFTLLRAFRKFAKTSRQLGTRAQNSMRVDTGGDARASRIRTNRINEKQFTIVTLLLSAVLVVCALPHVISVHISFYARQQTLQEELNLRAVITIGDEMMFLKVALDAFIYAWRLTKYRRSLKIVLGYEANRVEPNTNDGTTMENFTFQQ